MTGSGHEAPKGVGAALLGKAVRTERGFVFPPGTFASSLVVPCFAIAATLLTLVIALSIGKGLPILLEAFAAALALTGGSIAGHVSVVRGRAQHRKWFLLYVRILLVCVVIGAIALAVLEPSGPWPLLSVTGILFAACDWLLRSRAYRGFAHFFALRRKQRAHGKHSSH